jgi:hypothetical protein
MREGLLGWQTRNDLDRLHLEHYIVYGLLSDSDSNSRTLELRSRHSYHLLDITTSSDSTISSFLSFCNPSE